MKTFRRISLFVILTAALIGAGLLTARLLPAGEAAIAEPATTAEDEVAREEWRRAHPWLFQGPGMAAFRDRLILPYAEEYALGPNNLRRHGDIVELIVPRGRPVHDYAFALERGAVRASLRMLGGREIGGNAARVEYRFADAAGHLLILRISLGRGVLPGTSGLALVIVELGRASEEDFAGWLDFPEPVTLVFPDTHAVLQDGSRAEGREIFLELPMEPSGYPAVRPGPRTLFIDHSREEIGRILRERLGNYPAAAGFATRHGERAIENPRLMENTLSLLAERSLIFLDLTGSPRSLTASSSLRTGVESFVARVQAPGAERTLAHELELRAARAGRFGEGVWVLRHAPGLPDTLARVMRDHAEGLEEAGVRWVTLSDLRGGTRD